MRILLYSDLHLREERLEDAAQVLSEIPRLAIDHNVDRIVNGGDTFNTRGVIRTKCLKVLYDAYSEWARQGLKQTIIVGNHDQEDKAGVIHPMKIFERFPDWHVIDTPQISDGGVFIPYVSNGELKSFLTEHSFPKGQVAFVHLGFQGAMMNDSYRDTEGVPIEWFNKFLAVFSGHYHYRNKIKHVQYIGSPMQQNFSEMGQEKGVLIYDSALKKTEFIPIDGTPKHYEARVYWELGKKKWHIPKGITRDDFVRVIVEGDAERIGSIDRESLVKKIGCDSIKIHRDVKEKTVSRMNIGAGEIHNNFGLMKKYVDFVNTDLDKDRLLKVGKEILDASL